MPTNGSEKKLSTFVVAPNKFMRKALTEVLSTRAELEVLGAGSDVQIGLLDAMSCSPDVVLLYLEHSSDMCLCLGLMGDYPKKLKVIILHADFSSCEVYECIAASIMGLCSPAVAIDLLIAGMTVVASGCLWMDSIAYTELMSDTASLSGGSTRVLSSREKEVLRMVRDGVHYKAIAQELNISSDTVKTHMRHIRRTLAVHDRNEAALRAQRML